MFLPKINWGGGGKKKQIVLILQLINLVGMQDAPEVVVDRYGLSAC